MFPRGDGPFQVLERINDNAYKLDLSGKCNVSATFNVTDLSPFDVGDDLKTNPIQVPVGLVRRTRAKKFKETLNGLIQNI